MADQHGPTDQYGALFLALIGTLLISPFFGSGPAQRLAMVVIVGLVVLSSFRSTGVGSWNGLLVTVGIAIAALGPAAMAQGSVIRTIVLVVLAIGMAVGPPNIVRMTDTSA